MQTKNEFKIDCDCGHKGHFVSIGEWMDDDEPTFYAALCEADRKLPFLYRLKNGVKYILGLDNLNYIEVIWRKKEMLELKEFINNLTKKYE